MNAYLMVAIAIAVTVLFFFMIRRGGGRGSRTTPELLQTIVTLMFDKHLSLLRDRGTAEIASLLDRTINDRDTVDVLNRAPTLMFTDPGKVPEVDRMRFLLDTLVLIKDSEETDSPEGEVATVWFLSAAAVTFDDLRPRGRSLWNELSRGFPDCTDFDPANHVPKGLEPSVEMKRTPGYQIGVLSGFELIAKALDGDHVPLTSRIMDITGEQNPVVLGVWVRGLCELAEQDEKISAVNLLLLEQDQGEPITEARMELAKKIDKELKF